MVRYWRALGEYTGVAVAFEALAGGGGASPYTPQENARLVGIRLIIGATTAASLTENFIIRMTCSSFKPNMIEIAGTGGGLRTAPVQSQLAVDYPIDEAVQAGVPITLEGRHLVATAVTPAILVMGEFQS